MQSLAFKSAKRNYWFSLIAFVTSIACAVTVYILLTRKIDYIVHGDLYNFGLEYRDEWATPYRTIMMVIYSILAVPIAMSGISLYFSAKAKQTLRKYPPPLEVNKEVEKMVLQPKNDLNLQIGVLEPQTIPNSNNHYSPHLIKKETATPPNQTKKPTILQAKAKEGEKPTLKTNLQNYSPKIEKKPAPNTKETTHVTSNKSPAKEEDQTSLGEKEFQVTICSNCRRVISRPVFTLEFSSGKPELCKACPYCDNRLDDDAETTIDN